MEISLILRKPRERKKHMEKSALDRAMELHMATKLVQFVPSIERGHRSLKGGKSCPQGCRNEKDHTLDNEAKINEALQFVPIVPVLI